MSRTLRVARVAMLAALLAVGPMAVRGVAPAAALNPLLCGTTITATLTILTDDVGPCPGDGIVIGASGITLDLNGYDIIGNFNGDPLSGQCDTGVRVGSFNNVTVTDGTFVPPAAPVHPAPYAAPDPQGGHSRITGFNSGVTVSGGSGANTIKGLTVVGNVSLTSLLADCGQGVMVEGSDGNTVRHNYVSENGPYAGISLVGDADSNNIQYNVVTLNNVHGGESLQDIGVRLELSAAAAPNTNLIEENTITENGLDGVGIFFGAPAASSNTIRHNLIEGNRRNGIRLSDSAGTGGADLTSVYHNTVCANGSDGIYVASQDNVVDANQVGDGLGKIHIGAAVAPGGGLPDPCRTNGTWNGPGVDIRDVNTAPSCGNNTYSSNTFTTREPVCPVPTPPPAGVSDAAVRYSSYLGGSGSDDIRAVAVSADGESAYVTGQTCPTAFSATTGAYDTTANGGCDAFVAKFTTTTSGSSSLAYATYLGGSGTDVGTGIAVDSSGNAYVTGQTCQSGSTAFPTTSGAYDTTTASAGCDAFATKVNAGGASLGYSTFLGGDGADSGGAVAVDSAGKAYITGTTCASGSTAFPSTSGAYDTSDNGACDAFFAKFNAAGSALDYSTFLGGSGADSGASIAVSGTTPYVTGQTCQSGTTPFPTSSNAYDSTTVAGSCDAFVAKFDTALSGTAQLAYSTFLGGDPNGNEPTPADDDAYLAPDLVGPWPACVNVGETCDPDMPYIGSARAGAGADAGRGIAVDSSGNAYVTGFTFAENFPTTSPNSSGAYQKDRVGNCGQFKGGRSTTQPFRHMGDFQLFYQPKLPCPDAFVAKVNTTSTGAASLVYSTYLGGSDYDAANAIALDASGNAYVTGVTFSGSGTVPVVTSTSAYDGSCEDGACITRKPFPTTEGDTTCGTDTAGTCDSYTFEEIRPETPTATPCKASQTLYCEEHMAYIADAFITKVNSSGSALLYSTFLGGSNDDAGAGIGVGTAGATVVGKTCSTNFPTSATSTPAGTFGAYDTSSNGACDGFLTRRL